MSEVARLKNENHELKAQNESLRIQLQMYDNGDMKEKQKQLDKVLTEALAMKNSYDEGLKILKNKTKEASLMIKNIKSFEKKQEKKFEKSVDKAILEITEDIKNGKL